MKVQGEEALAACPRQMAQKGSHQTDPVRRRSAFPELINEQKGPRGAAAHHLRHLQGSGRAVWEYVWGTKLPVRLNPQ